MCEVVRVRVRRWAWGLACWLALALPAAAEVQTLVQARVAASDAERFPEDAPVRTVRLPDDWADARADATVPRWYRLDFTPQPGGGLQAVYVERACTNMELRLNGELLFSGGAMREPLARNCMRPQLVVLPQALLREGGNQIDVKLAGYPLRQVASRQRAGSLSALLVGPHQQLAARHALEHALQVTAPQLASAMLMLMGLFILVIGALNRREPHLATFGALSVCWALLTARLWWRDWPLPNFAAELAIATLVALAALAAVRFLLQHAGRRAGAFTLALAAQCVALPLTLGLAGPDRMHDGASVWYALLALQVLAAIALSVSRSWRLRRASDAPLALATLVIAALLLQELVAQRVAVDTAAMALGHIAMTLLFVAVGLHLMLQYGRALQAAEAGRESLESRILEATAEAERNFAQLAELRVEQVTERERKRIAADLHDDLGAKLLTIVHTSESDRISTLAREALEEMRLSVRGLTGRPLQLNDALGDWRAEVISRLQQADIEADWQAPAEELARTLSARAYVQTTRILREAVNNIIKHSGAKRCLFEVAISDGDFRILIQDNGKGIPLELDGRLDRGHGMSSMKHRAKQLQGQCLVESGPGYGTVIRLTLPLDQHIQPG